MVAEPHKPIAAKTQDAVVLHLKRAGEMTVSQLCAALGITSMAVRRHLSGLKRQGLVESRVFRQPRGRPSYRWRLTDRADLLFPSDFKNLTVELLDALREVGGTKAVMELLKVRNKRLAAKLAPRMQDKSLAEKVEEVAKIFSESGFMTDWEVLADGNFLIYQQHCAVHSVAEEYRQLCVLEPQLIEALLGCKVVRKQYMLDKDPVCGYLIEALNPL